MKFYKFIYSTLLILLLFHACRKDDSYFQGMADYSIEKDTLLFDTVFTTIGSATRILKVYNHEKHPILVDIKLEKGSTSFFRMNADGFQGNDLKNIEVQGNDSIYIFIEVTIDPDMPLSDSPFVVEENLLISHNDQVVKTLLMAFGQNANYVPRANERGLITSLCTDFNTITWDDPKPYVIYGILIIDSCTLVLPPGTNVYVHGGIVVRPDVIYNEGQIITLQHGKIIAKGSYDLPVKIEGDRLEPEYDDVAGQWVGVRLLNGSTGNIIENTIIRNSVVGIQVDSGANLNLKNTIIENTSSSGLIGRHSSINAENVLIHSNGGNAISLTYGGEYQFDYTTLASYVDKGEALIFTNYQCLDQLCNETDYYPASLKMTNCIMAGGSNDEIKFDDIKKDEGIADAFVYEMSNCIVKVDSLIKPKYYPDFFSHCTDCLNLKFADKLFLDVNKSMFSLDTMSVARMRAKPIPSVSNDLYGHVRKLDTPDIGCIEFE